ncbi:MAG: ribosome recycling factor [Saprospirales bacterium]|nr:MAG: ribosome recycling factor [Saprospirales bacterium]
MEGNLEDNILLGQTEMGDAIEHLQKELLKVRTGKAAPSMVSGLTVDYYGSPTPLHQVANVSASDSKTLTIQPWEKSMLGPIEKAIFEANLGLTPMNDGEVVRISIPPLTEERRKVLVKNVKSLGEDAKISLRNTRQKLMEMVKKEVKEGYPEDAGKRKEDEIQKMVNSFGVKVDQIVELKEKDIMTI